MPQGGYERIPGSRLSLTTRHSSAPAEHGQAFPNSGPSHLHVPGTTCGGSLGLSAPSEKKKSVPEGGGFGNPGVLRQLRSVPNSYLNKHFTSFL
jgi:hypothetical protein